MDGAKDQEITNVFLLVSHHKLAANLGNLEEPSLWHSLELVCMHAMLNCFSCVRLFATLWTVACQASLSIQFPRQEYWSGLPCPPPSGLPNLGVKPVSLMSPALAGGFFTTSTTCILPIYKPGACIAIKKNKSSACLNN